MSLEDDVKRASTNPAMQRPAATSPRWFSWLLSRHRLPVQAVIDLEDPLSGAMKDAEVLLAFAAQSRHPLKRETIQALTTASAALTATRHARQTPTAEQLTSFWQAYDGLANDMAPLSARSIRASMALNAKRFPASLFTATGINALIAFFVFFICILLQGFWGAGRELLDKAEALDAQKSDVLQRMQRNEGVLQRRQSQIDYLNLQICPPDGMCPEDFPGLELPKAVPVRRPQLSKEEDAKLRAEKNVATAEMREKEAVLFELNNELQAQNDRSRAVEAVITSWYARATAVCEKVRLLCPIEAKGIESDRVDKLRRAVETLEAERERSASPAKGAASSERDSESRLTYGERLRSDPLQRKRWELAAAEADWFRGTLHRVRLTLVNLGSYLIPLFMGLLGALAFILRSLTIQLRDHTYVHMSASLAVIRMCLGAVAGVFGTILAPGSEGALKGLPPLIVPFVFGYGIEILFSLMDRVVNSFAQSDAAVGRDKTPA